MNVQVFLGASQGQAPSCVRCEIAQIPPFEKTPEGRDSWVQFQRAQGGDTELAFVVKFHNFGFTTLFFVYGLYEAKQVKLRFSLVDLPPFRVAPPGNALSFIQNQERKWPSMALTLPSLPESPP